MSAATSDANVAKPNLEDAQAPARCVFEGLTRQQARTLAEWFEGAGEQDADLWFFDRKVPSPVAHVTRPGGYLEDRGDEIVVHCYTSPR